MCVVLLCTYKVIAFKTEWQRENESESIDHDLARPLFFLANLQLKCIPVSNAVLLWCEKHFKMTFISPLSILRLVYREMDIITSDDPIIGHAIILKSPSCVVYILSFQEFSSHCYMEFSHLKGPQSASTIFDAFEIIDIAWWQKRIPLLCDKFIHKTEGTVKSFFGSI